MKTAHKIILILFIIVFLNLARPIHSYATRYGEALLNKNTSSWDSNQIKMPAVIYDKALYKMLYGGQGTNGRWQIGLAYSLDGINWIKFINPVKSRLAYDSRDVHDPSWLFNTLTNKYEMWYTSSTNSGSTDLKIYHSESIDGLYWTNDQDIIVHKPEASWEIEMVSCPNVLLIDNKYYMWIAGRSNTWKIGLFTSDDGITWIPNLNNPVLIKTYDLEAPNLISPEVYYDKNSTEKKFNMFYSTTDLGASSAVLFAYSPDGISWTKPVNENPIIIKSSISPSFDKNGVAESSVIKTSESTFIWYSGHYLGSSGIGLAYLGAPPTPLPTPTGSLFPSIAPTPASTTSPTPTPSPTPSPTPTPTPLPPIIIVPGMFSSWNKEEMLENKQNTSSTWKLLGFIKEYNGLIKTLKNLGYTENKNLFIWPYDWRQTITETTNKLNEFITSQVETKNPNTKINLIGHSLGGLIARTWAQSNADKVLHLITVGSPNQGVIQPYQAWEGGDISQDTNFLTLLSKLLIQIRKTVFQTDREVIQQTFPVLHDLLPTSPYLIRSTDNTEIQKSSMHVWNDWLTTLNTQIPTIYPLFDAVTGSGSQTPAQYKVALPSNIDALLGNWVDGKPIETIKQTGDGTVIQSRAAFSDDASWNIEKGHGELIASKEGIDKILQLFTIDHTDSDITEGHITSLAPGLLFLLRSPAIVSVTDDYGNAYTEQDGILVIPQAKNGNYHVLLTGTDTGTYHLIIGQFSDSHTKWIEIENTISPATTRTYDIAFNAHDPLDIPVTNLFLTDWLDQIDVQIQHLTTTPKNIYNLRATIGISRLYAKKKNSFIAKIQLERLLLDLSLLRRRTNSAELIQQTIDVGKTIQYAYISSFTRMPIYFSEHIRIPQKNETHRTNTEVSRSIEQKLNKKIISQTQLLLYQEAQANFQIAQSAFQNKEFTKAYIYYFQAKLLFSESLSSHFPKSH